MFTCVATVATRALLTGAAATALLMNKPLAKSMGTLYVNALIGFIANSYSTLITKLRFAMQYSIFWNKCYSMKFLIYKSDKLALHIMRCSKTISLRSG